MSTTAPAPEVRGGHVADEKVLILDFGSQYAQLIARRVREQHVYCEIVRHSITAERVAQLRPRGLILSGGPNSVYEPGAPRAILACSGWAFPSWASATACNWPATCSAAKCKARRPANTAGPKSKSPPTPTCSREFPTKPKSG